jgi:N-acetylneuraminic acid mutarotase
MEEKSAFWILSVLLLGAIVGPASPASAPVALAAHDAARGASGCVDDTWTGISRMGNPDQRVENTTVWSGSEMIIWGGRVETLPGQPPVPTNTGSRYDPATDTWTATSTEGAPSARTYHTAVWTGTAMIVWGGGPYQGSPTNTGARYDPATDTWTAISTDGAPSARRGHTAVWTGREMIVWGGTSNLPLDNTGGRYDPETDTWTPISTDGAPSARYGHTAVWTGTEMIIWAGYLGAVSSELNTGGRYDPATDTWTATSTEGAPSARAYHTAIWTGTAMIVWGGHRDGGGDGCSLTWDCYTGGRYEPATDTWTATSTEGAPSGRSGHIAVWTGTEMVIWGGSTNTGGRYDPAADTWRATSLIGPPDQGYSFNTAVWTGTEMMVWSGEVDVACNKTGCVYDTVSTGARYCALVGSGGI